MKKSLITLWILILLFSLVGCSIDWNDERNSRISELEKQVSKIQNASTSLKSIPDTSFKAHIIQIGGIHSKIYNGSYWQISSLDEPFPQDDSLIQDIEGLDLKIEFDNRKAYFNISCPTGFQISNCNINNSNVNVNSSSCQFVFPNEPRISDISFICNNGKLLAPL